MDISKVKWWNIAATVRTDIRHEFRPYLDDLSLYLDEAVDLVIMDK